MAARRLARERNETDLERVDRNFLELLQEVRVVSIGVQVLLGFLLIVPFSAGFDKVSEAQRYLYLAVLLAVAIAAGLLIAPTVLHRLIFRRGDKPYLVETANRFTILGIVFLMLAMIGILSFVTGTLFGWVAATVITALASGFFGGSWFGVGLRRRRQLEREP